MEIEHLTLWMLNKNALGDISLRLLFYLQIVHKMGPSPEKRIIYVSRRRVCKKLSISIGACRAAVKQLADLGFIKLSDSKGNPIEDYSSNWMVLQKKEDLNKPRIQQIIETINKTGSTSDGGSVKDPRLEGLFDNIMNE